VDACHLSRYFNTLILLSLGVSLLSRSNGTHARRSRQCAMGEMGVDPIESRRLPGRHLGVGRTKVALAPLTNAYSLSFCGGLKYTSDAEG